MVRKRRKYSHLGAGKRKRNDEGTSLGEDANPEDGSCFPTLLPKHKIFLSHSGKQKWFVEKLCEDLEARHRFPFFDKRPSSLPKGERFAKLILEGAAQCEMAVVVVSEEYLTSKWPMIELNTFVQALSGSNPQLKILPLFFEMSVSDLKSCSRQGAWLKVWNEWAREDARIKPVEFENALKVMASFNGIELNDRKEVWRYEKEVVRSICSAVAGDVKWEDSHVQGRSTICEATREKIKVIEPSVKNGVCVFGYYGMGGIGKTTMCKTLCNELLEFSGKVCHIELGSTQSEAEMLKGVLRKLTSLSEELFERLDVGECCNILRNPSSWRQKTFLAIDNVWDDNESMVQAQMFLDEPAFQEGSVVMVTSRCRSTLVHLGIPESHCFEVPELGEVDARKLFLHHVAKGEEFHNEDNRVIEECIARCRFRKGETQGFHYLPLALKVLGVHLKRLGHSPGKWSKELPRVRDFNRFPGDNPVFDIIRLNYDRLSVQLQELFMDVALFTRSNIRDDNVDFIWLSLVHRQKLQDTQSQLQELKERGLVEDVDMKERGLVEDVYMNSGRVSMHDLYKEFAEMEAEGKLSRSVGFKRRRWVFCRGSYPSDLERVPSGRCWENLTRVDMVLDHDDPGAAFNLQSIQLRYCSNLVVLKLKLRYCSMALRIFEGIVKQTGVLNLEGLRCLRSLELDGLKGDVVEGVEDLTNLRCFRWDCHWAYGSKNEFHGLSSLGQLPASLEILVLHGAGICLRCDAFDRCSNLRLLSLHEVRASDSMDFRHCSSLRSVELKCILGLRKLLGLTAGLQSCLQSLEISWCDDLSDVSGLGDLVGLVRLVALDNPLLEELIDLQRLTRLEFLEIRRTLLSFGPYIMELRGLGGLRQLRELHCRRLDVTELPSLSALNGLHILNLMNCKKLTSVKGVAGLTALRRVSLSGCESLLRLPDLSNSTKLEELDLEWSGIEIHEEDMNMLAVFPGLRRVIIGLSTQLDPVRRKVVKNDYVYHRWVVVETSIEMLPLKVSKF